MSDHHVPGDAAGMLTDEGLVVLKENIESQNVPTNQIGVKLPGTVVVAMADELLASRRYSALSAKGPMHHITGHPVQVGPMAKQLCAWCGKLLCGYDLRTLAIPNKEDGSPGDLPLAFDQGVVVCVDGNSVTVVATPLGEQLPEPNCVYELEEEKKPPKFEVIKGGKSN